MKRINFRHVTQTGAKLLFSIMALLLVLTGCNAPTPNLPEDPTTPPNTQETELPTELPTEQPTEQPTEEPTSQRTEQKTEEITTGKELSFEDQLKQDLKKNGFFKKYADEELSFIFFAQTNRFCAFFVERTDGYTGNPSTFDIGGLRFHYANRQWIMVWCNGNTAWLEDAYNNGWLNKTELQAVYDGYLAVYPERKDPVGSNVIVAEPAGGPLSEEMQATISAAMKAKTGFSWVYKLKNGATYYGKYGNCYVVLDTPEASAGVVTTKTYCGYAFVLGRPFELYAYCDGTLYTLAEAVDAGKLSQDDVQKIYEFHTTYNWKSSN